MLEEVATVVEEGDWVVVVAAVLLVSCMFPGILAAQALDMFFLAF